MSPLSIVVSAWRTWGVRAMVVAGAIVCATGCSNDTTDSPASSEQYESGPTNELTESELGRLEEILDACPRLEDMDPELIPPDVAHEVLPIPDPEPPNVCPVLEEAQP